LTAPAVALKVEVVAFVSSTAVVPTHPLLVVRATRLARPHPSEQGEKLLQRGLKF